MVNKNILNRAIKEAENSDVIRGKVGAVIFSNSRHIVTFGHNSTFLGSSRIRTIHAEESALNKAFKINAFNRYSDLKILIIRWKKGTKELAHAKPCIDCQKALRKSKIKEIYYSDILGNIVRMEKMWGDYE